MPYLWKCLKADMRSRYGNCQWAIGEWKTEGCALEMCEVGFHASPRIIDAMSYVSLGRLARVEVKGRSIIDHNKQCWSEMRVIAVYQWTKEYSVRLAVYAAELVLHLFEERHPEDSRPRDTILTAKQYLSNTGSLYALAAENARRAAIEYTPSSRPLMAAEESANAASWAALAADNDTDKRVWAARSAVLSAAAATGLAADRADAADAADGFMNKIERFIHDMLGIQEASLVMKEAPRG